MGSTSRLSCILMCAAAFTTGGCDASRNPVAPGPAAVSLADSNAPAVDAAARPGEGKVDVCHVTGNGRYQPLTVSSSAERAHRAHGDAAVGESVPGLQGMMFDANCAAVPRSTVITEGRWIVDPLERQAFAQFTMGGRDLTASGTWRFAQALGICTTCVPGQVITLRAVFDNPTPNTFATQASGSATVAGSSYPFVEFGGPLMFEGGSVTIPSTAGIPPGTSQTVSVSTSFVLSGQFKGYEVLGRRDPLLAFDVPVSGRGTATLEMIGHGGLETLQLYRLVFDFTE